MTGLVAVKYGNVGGKSAKLFRPDRLADALSDFCEERWPLGRRKAVAREWGLTDDQARTVCEGSASKATLETIFKHKRGGWPLVIDVFARLLGEGIDQHLERERRTHADHVERLGALVGHLRVVGDPRRDGAARGSDDSAGSARATGRRVGDRSFQETDD